MLVLLAKSGYLFELVSILLEAVYEVELVLVLLTEAVHWAKLFVILARGRPAEADQDKGQSRRIIPEVGPNKCRLALEHPWLIFSDCYIDFGTLELIEDWHVVVYVFLLKAACMVASKGESDDSRAEELIRYATGGRQLK